MFRNEEVILAELVPLVTAMRFEARGGVRAVAPEDNRGDEGDDGEDGQARAKARKGRKGDRAKASASSSTTAATGALGAMGAGESEVDRFVPILFDLLENASSSSSALAASTAANTTSSDVDSSGSTSANTSSKSPVPVQRLTTPLKKVIAAALAHVLSFAYPAPASGAVVPLIVDVRVADFATEAIAVLTAKLDGR